MKRTISVLACLALLCTSQLQADAPMATNSNAPRSSDTDSITTKEPTNKKSTLHTIPRTTLSLDMDNATGKLKVDLSGKMTQNLNWVIFQPKGKVISRLSTNYKIDQIKTDSLDQGDYVLMVKDAEGRALFQKFTKG